MRAERPPVAVAFCQVVVTIEPEVPAGRTLVVGCGVCGVVVGGVVDGPQGAPEQVLGVQLGNTARDDFRKKIGVDLA